jgi:Nif-specific regulatory protein
VELAQGVAERLGQHPWPGNVRQLENVIHRAVLMAEGPLVSTRLIDRILAQESHIASAQPPRAPTASEAAPATDQALPQGAGNVRPYARVDPSEGERLLAAVRQCGGNKTQAAIMLGLTPRQLRYRLDKLGLEA